MTQEEKELLMIDLSARFPYGVKCCASGEIPEWFKKLCVTKDPVKVDFKLDIVTFPYVIKNYDVDVKPYLRPMSSMTENEFRELKSYSGLIYDQLELSEFSNNSKCLEFYLSEIPSYVVILVFDWLNKHHFDYRGLIPMGLALEAPEDMYGKIMSKRL